MKGCTFSELFYALNHNHEIEFLYKEEEYKIELIVKERQSFLVIYSMEPFKYLAEKCLGYDEKACKPTPKEAIIYILNCKCFDGKSFYDIEKDVEVTAIC